MKPLRFLLVGVFLLTLIPASALPQALTSLASLRVGYNTRKVTANPQEELKAQIDALDRQIAEATRLGRSGELRRLFAQGMMLLSGASAATPPHMWKEQGQPARFLLSSWGDRGSS